ncbi:MAG: glycosyltransferase family 9 protein [Acidobacteriota bacterium]
MNLPAIGHSARRRLNAIVRSVRYDQPPAAVLRTLTGLAVLVSGRRGRRVSLDEIGSILIVRNDGLGDNILTAPLLRAIRDRFSAAKIGLLTTPLASGLYGCCPYVDAVYVQDRPLHGQPLLRLADVWMMAGRLFRDARFDLAILPRWDQDADGGVLMAVMSGAPERVGYSTCVNPDEHPRNRGLDRYLTWRLVDGSVKHEVLRTLEPARRLGDAHFDDRLELWPAAEDQEWARAFGPDHAVPAGGRIVVLGIGAAVAKRVWPHDRVIEMARRIAATAPTTFLIVGGPADGAAGDTIAAVPGLHAINLCGGPSLNQLAALLQAADVYIGNDTGMMHLAAAASLPCVVISCHPLGASPGHANSPERFHPWGVPFRYARPHPVDRACRGGCQSAAAHCILNVSVDEVFEQWLTLRR